jgi:hypothetical protein
MTSAPEITANEEMRIELVVEHVVTHTSAPEGKPLILDGLRELSKGLLRLYRLPIPDDAWLDEFIREMREWHKIPMEP